MFRRRKTSEGVTSAVAGACSCHAAYHELGVHAPGWVQPAGAGGTPVREVAVPRPRPASDLGARPHVA